MKDLKDYIKSIKLLTMYHSTFDDFDDFDFKKSPFGMHFGTIESASSRIEKKIEEDDRLGGYALAKKKDNPIMLECRLTFENPLELNENRTGRWYPSDVLQEIIEKAESEGVEGVTKKEIEDYYMDELSYNGVMMVDLDQEEYGGEEYNTELKEHLFVRDWLKSKGYDSIVYNNEFEGGGKSVIIFDEHQQQIISKEYLNKEEKTPNKKPKIK